MMKNSKPKKQKLKLIQFDMKKVIFFLLIFVVTGCASKNIYSDFDYGFARSGGFAPIYENLVIKGHNAHYSFEGQGKKIKKDFAISKADLTKIEQVLTENEFRKIQEQYNKLYDNIAVEINVKKGNNSGNKNDNSLIMEKDQQKWNNIVAVFQEIINKNIKTKSGQ